MIRKISAEIIFDGLGNAFEDHVLIMDGPKVLGLESLDQHELSTIESYDGILMPGMINTHCHLELSHMKGRVGTGAGLLPFIGQVVQFRDIPQHQIDAAIVAGDKEMQSEGIVAVGDISNKTDTSNVKSQSPIQYYTFVEMFDFLQPKLTSATIEQYKLVFDGQSDKGKNQKSYSPHAPYSVSADLFDYIKKNNSPGSTVSIHNEETIHENELFLTGKGGFVDWYKGFGFNLDQFIPTKTTSIHYAMQHMDPSQRNLFVHNTMMSKEDIQAAQVWGESIFWATCANANLYIENRLPNYQLFLDLDAKMTIGTDSLTSNWQLSVWEEIKTIRKFASYVPLGKLIQWATINGAEALGFDDHLGSFEKGKEPGVNLVSCRVEDGRIEVADSKVQKIV